jgi:hypothetical protein
MNHAACTLGEQFKGSRPLSSPTPENPRELLSTAFKWGVLFCKGHDPRPEQELTQIPCMVCLDLSASSTPSCVHYKERPSVSRLHPFLFQITISS